MIPRVGYAAALEQIRRDIARLQHRIDEATRSAKWRRDDQERRERDADQRDLYRQAALRLSERLARLAVSDRPVVLGPWTGEIGFELLYWIPLLTWAVGRRRLPSDRLIAASRGGARLWYEHLTSAYVDVFEAVTPDTFSAHGRRLKQTSVTDVDRAVVRTIRRRSGRVDLLHPKVMYDLFIPLWRLGGSVADIRSFSRTPRFSQPEPQHWQAQLPSDYIAVKFYASGQFPDTGETRRFARDVVRRLTTHSDVVLLTAGSRLDEHADIVPDAGPRVHRIDHLVEPGNNLDIQSRILASARAFVGSYGGFSYLAPSYGVPSVSFFAARDAFFQHHLELALAMYSPPAGPGFVALDTRDVALLDAIMAGPVRATS